MLGEAKVKQAVALIHSYSGVIVDRIRNCESIHLGLTVAFPKRSKLWNT